jgi:hypothetical protein
VRVTAIAPAVSDLTSGVHPSEPSSQMADGLGNGLSGAGTWKGYAFIVAMVGSISFWKTADCRPAAQSVLLESMRKACSRRSGDRRTHQQQTRHRSSTFQAASARLPTQASNRFCGLPTACTE